MVKFFSVIVLAVVLTGCSKPSGSIIFQMNGMSSLKLPSSLLVESQITPLDDFLILINADDSIHIDTLNSTEFSKIDIDLRDFPEYLFGKKSTFPVSDYGLELKSAYELHKKMYPLENNKLENKGLLDLYIASNESIAIVYVVNQNITDQITSIILKSSDLKVLIDIVIKGIYYDGPK